MTAAPVRKVTVWPRKCRLPPSLIDLADALQRAAARHPARDTFTASELFSDFSGPSPAVAGRVARNRSAQFQRCLQNLRLELRAHELGCFRIRRLATVDASNLERNAA